MAITQNIGLRITLGGITEVISNISQLEEAIKQARDRLKGLEIGSGEFKNLTNEIRTAESSLKDLNKAAEGLEFEQKLEAFARVGGAITSSFAAAQAAVTLFGGDAEKVSEAAVKAQNLLTIALTARSIAEGAAGLKTVALTVKTVAQTLATNASTVATRTLYTVIAANPIGALVTVIGLAVTALLAFTSSSEEAEDSQDKLDASLQRVNASFDQQIALLELAGGTQIEVQRERVKQAQENFEILEKEFERQRTANRFSEETEKARLAAIEAKNKLDIENARLNRFIDDETKKREEQLEADRKKRDDLNKQRLQEQIALKKEQIIKEQELARAELLRFSKGQEFGGLEIEKQIKDRIVALDQENQKLDETSNLIQKYRNENVIFSNAEIESFKKLGLQVDVVEDKIEKYNGTQSDYFGLLNKNSMLQNAQIQKTAESFGKSAREVAVEFAKLKGVIQTSFGESFGSELFKDIESELKKLQTNQKLVEQGFTRIGKTVPENFANIVKSIQDVESGVGMTFEELQTSQKNFDNLRNNYIKNYITSNATLSKSDKNYQVQQEELRKTGEQYFDQLVTNQKNVNNYNTSIQNISNSISELIKKQNEFVQSGKSITQFLQQNSQDITKQFDLALFGVKNTSSEIARAREALDKSKTMDPTSLFNFEDVSVNLEILERELRDASGGVIDIDKASYEERLKLLILFLEKKEALEKSGTEKTIQQIQQGIQSFQSVLNSLAQTSSQYYAFQLDLLAKQSEEIQSKIVGDSEEAIQLRLEQEQIYNQKKKDLEKQSALTALRISFAQSLANTAEAITKAFTAGPIVGQIAAGLIAVISASQTALIGSQIAQIQSLQRGGMIKGQGGLVMGAPHEFGGVKFQNGGIELEGGESVINRQSSIRYGSLLNQVNQLGGGRPLTSNTFDDSRIVEAIAKQRNEPIRAYVVEQDITTKQGVSRRLEQLSQI